MTGKTGWSSVGAAWGVSWIRSAPRSAGLRREAKRRSIKEFVGAAPGSPRRRVRGVRDEVARMGDGRVGEVGRHGVGDGVDAEE